MTNLFQQKIKSVVEKISNLMFVEQKILTNLRMFTFKYVEKLGKGTFGIVMKVEDRKGNVFALKTVFEYTKHYYREKEILESLNNPHFIHLYEYAYFEESIEGKYLQLVFEFVPYSLSDLIRHDRFELFRQYYGEVPNLKEEIVKGLLKQGFEGLKYLHSFEIAHRDIKPPNILIDYDGTLKFCDLGSAKKLGEKNNTTYICSRYYRSPENIMGMKNYDTKIDIWSFSLSIAEILTRKVIFKGDSNTNQLEKILGLLQVSQKDLLAMKLKRSTRKTMGIKKLMKRCTSDKALVDVFDKTIKFNFHRRKSADQVLEMKIFKSEMK